MQRQVLVTGAGSGFGLDAAVRLARAGFAVTGLVRTAEDARALEDVALGERLEIDILVADLADPDQRRGLLDDRPLWGLVNNAGYMNAGQLRDVPIDDARLQIETMVLAPVDLARQSLPGMIDRGQGRIVNVTSSAVHTSTPLTAWYQACKAALRELNDSLRLEVAPCGIEVVDIEPGGYRTGIWSGAERELQERAEGTDRPEVYGRVLRRIRPARALMGRPGSVGQAVVDVLTTGRPPAHVRIGPGATWLRLADHVVPDRAWDPVMRRVAGIR